MILRILIDERERNCNVPSYLKDLGVYVLFKQLMVGDYIISNDCAVERKQVNDFVNSLVQGRLFDQAYRLSEAYHRSAIIIEGDHKDIYDVLKSGVKAFYGILSSIWLNLGTSFFFTQNEYDTAQLLYSLIKHEQELFRKPIAIKGKSKFSSVSEKQLMVVSSFPGVGYKLALRLLNHFGSLKNIINASVVELSTIKGFSHGKAEKLVNFFNAKFEDSKNDFKQAKLDL
ncbi:MAG: ERCC4 domain-containing protein [Candidatus Methanomethylicia archaeon]